MDFGRRRILRRCWGGEHDADIAGAFGRWWHAHRLLRSRCIHPDDAERRLLWRLSRWDFVSVAHCRTVYFHQIGWYQLDRRLCVAWIARGSSDRVTGIHRHANILRRLHR